MKIILIGAGNIGRAFVRDVLEIEPDATILAVDADRRALDAATALGFGDRRRPASATRATSTRSPD